jgi:hypothetical protein
MEKAIASFAKQLYVDSDLILIAQKNQVIAVIMGTIQQRQGKCFLIVVEQNHVIIGIEKTQKNGREPRVCNVFLGGCDCSVIRVARNLGNK